MIVIGLSTNRDFKDGSDCMPKDYVLSVLRAGALPLILPMIPEHHPGYGDFLDKALKAVDAVVFTGGPDLHPSHYHETILPECNEPVSERDAIEGVSMGTLEMTLISSAPLANFTNAFLVFDLPFIIQDRQKAYAWMDGPEGRKILDSVLSKGMVGLGIWENGFRMLTNSKKPVAVPDDLKGLKIRLMENPIHVGTFKTLGAYPVPMPFGELFTALQQSTVDGQENPLIIISTSKFAEVQKYLSLTGHFYAPAILLINKAFWENTLTEDLRKIFTEAELKALQKAGGVAEESKLTTAGAS